MVALTNGRSMTTQGGMAFENAGGRGGSEQVAIAIDPEEVVPLTQALGANQTIHAVAKSGQVVEATDRGNELAGMVSFPAAAVKIEGLPEGHRRGPGPSREPASRGGYYFQPDDASEKWINRVDQLWGRVVRRDIDPGYIFSESDFLPPDSVVREIPAYERIEADDLADPSLGEFVGRGCGQRPVAGPADSGVGSDAA